MKIYADLSIIPMVMFHSVGLESYPWVYSHLSEPVDLFDAKLDYLVRKGYRTLFWSDLYDHMTGRRIRHEKSIVLTFDDGYLDNWVYVYPLLKKYGVKATIFVNPAFVDPSSGCRKNIEYETDIQPSNAAGFLNWEEMRQMHASGLVDIQSHAMNHTWFFSGPRVVDFHHPGDRYPWLAWNVRQNRQPFYLIEDQSSFVRWGSPVYEYEKALICRRFVPDPGVALYLENFTLEQDADFWKRPDWNQVLRHELDRWMTDRSIAGTYETDQEYQARVVRELEQSKKIISEQLNKPVDFICWPGGGYNNTVIRLAKEVGYKAWTLSSRDSTEFRNRPGVPSFQVKRIASQSRRICRGMDIGLGTPEYFYHRIREHQGEFFSWFWVKMNHLSGLIPAYFH